MALKLHDNCSRYMFVAIFYSVWSVFGLYSFHLEYSLVIEYRCWIMKGFNINWTFIGPSIVICFHSKPNQVHQFLKFILFWNNTLHVSDGLSVHHQEFKTVHIPVVRCM